MNGSNPASLVNLLGFSVGVALYALLLVMVVRHRRTRAGDEPDFLLLATAVLGLLWNLGELFVFVWRDFVAAQVSPSLVALSYSALGFLPSVVVHAAWKNSEKKNRNARWLTLAAYFLSSFAAVLHFQSAFRAADAPSSFALRVLTFGSLALLAGLLLSNLRQTLERKTVWIAALSVFAFSALHLSGDAEETSWLVELVAHQSSLPLALAILLQDYRFAFADLFLKRALSLILLALAAFGLYVFVAAPLLHFHETHDRDDAAAISLILVLWMATALVYPLLHRFAVWLVDKIILRRADYGKLRLEITQAIEKHDSAENVLTEICRCLAPALTAREAFWTETAEREADSPGVNFSPDRAEIFVPTAEASFYKISLRDFAGGRRLLSDETMMLESVGVAAARRIDALRVTHERCELELREREFSRLATEAQLTALRAQINPHFLFNALTTVQYLIQTAPEKASATLMRLTQLLRGVLRSTGEFSTLGDELKLIESYLEIEKARFEERLDVKISVAQDLLKMRLPSLILQPLVENAIKHGVSKSKSGGAVEINAKLETAGEAIFINLTVFNSGAGIEGNSINSGKFGVGLNNVERRLDSYYGGAAEMTIESRDAVTQASIRFPVERALNLKA